MPHRRDDKQKSQRSPTDPGDRISLAWPTKDCVLRPGHGREGVRSRELYLDCSSSRKEIDGLLEPKVLTNWKRYTPAGAQSVNEIRRNDSGTIQENLLVKGDNLLALHALTPQFRGKVKLIYIDPPFNTGGAASTFTYNNTFDHAAWLTFMKNRIETAKPLLTNAGILVVAIDHFELFYLGVMLDEIFGRDNRMGIIAVVHNPGGRQDGHLFPIAHENMLFYARNIAAVRLNRLGPSPEKLAQFKLKDRFGNYKLRGFRRSGNNSLRENRPNLYYPIYYNPETGRISLERSDDDSVEILPIDRQGIERCWRWGPRTLLEKRERYVEVKLRRNGYDIYIKEREDDYRGEKAKTVWNKPYYSGQTGTHELKSILGAKLFSYPKSPYLLRDVIAIATEPGDIVLDFFAGSGTTAAVAHKMRRQWLAVEQMDTVETVTIARLRKVVGRNRNARGGRAAGIEYDTGGVSESVGWKGGGDFVSCELLRRNEDWVNLSDLDDKRFGVGHQDKVLNRSFFADAPGV